MVLPWTMGLENVQGRSIKPPAKQRNPNWRLKAIQVRSRWLPQVRKQKNAAWEYLVHSWSNLSMLQSIMRRRKQGRQKMAELDKQTQTELEADVLRTLIGHLDKRSDVQNIDLMNLAGFCRNCLSKWYVAAAREKGLEVSMDEARQHIYGMSYDEWKEKYQKDATPEQVEKFKKVMADPKLTT